MIDGLNLEGIDNAFDQDRADDASSYMNEVDRSREMMHQIGDVGLRQRRGIESRDSMGILGEFASGVARGTERMGSGLMKTGEALSSMVGFDTGEDFFGTLHRNMDSFYGARRGGMFGTSDENNLAQTSAALIGEQLPIIMSTVIGAHAGSSVATLAKLGAGATHATVKAGQMASMSSWLYGDRLEGIRRASDGRLSSAQEYGLAALSTFTESIIEQLIGPEAFIGKAASLNAISRSGVSRAMAETYGKAGRSAIKSWVVGIGTESLTEAIQSLSTEVYEQVAAGDGISLGKEEFTQAFTEALMAIPSAAFYGGFGAYSEYKARSGFVTKYNAIIQKEEVAKAQMGEEAFADFDAKYAEPFKQRLLERFNEEGAEAITTVVRAHALDWAVKTQANPAGYFDAFGMLFTDTKLTPQQVAEMRSIQDPDAKAEWMRKNVDGFRDLEAGVVESFRTDGLKKQFALEQRENARIFGDDFGVEFSPDRKVEIRPEENQTPEYKEGLKAAEDLSDGELQASLDKRVESGEITSDQAGEILEGSRDASLVEVQKAQRVGSEEQAAANPQEAAKAERMRWLDSLYKMRQEVARRTAEDFSGEKGKGWQRARTRLVETTAVDMFNSLVDTKKQEGWIDDSAMRSALIEVMVDNHRMSRAKAAELVSTLQGKDASKRGATRTQLESVFLSEMVNRPSLSDYYSDEMIKDAKAEVSQISDEWAFLQRQDLTEDLLARLNDALEERGVLEQEQRRIDSERREVARNRRQDRAEVSELTEAESVRRELEILDQLMDMEALRDEIEVRGTKQEADRIADQIEDLSRELEAIQDSSTMFPQGMNPRATYNESRRMRRKIEKLRTRLNEVNTDLNAAPETWLTSEEAGEIFAHYIPDMRLAVFYKNATAEDVLHEWFHHVDIAGLLPNDIRQEMDKAYGINETSSPRDIWIAREKAARDFVMSVRDAVEQGLASPEFPDDVQRSFKYLHNVFSQTFKAAEGFVVPGQQAVSESAVVYHGGAVFNNPSLKHNLTGQGVNAFGNGMYLTEVKEIAEDYAKEYAPRAPQLDLKNDVIPRMREVKNYVEKLVSDAGLMADNEVAEAIDDGFSTINNIFNKWSEKKNSRSYSEIKSNIWDFFLLDVNDLMDVNYNEYSAWFNDTFGIEDQTMSGLHTFDLFPELSEKDYNLLSWYDAAPSELVDLMPEGFNGQDNMSGGDLYIKLSEILGSDTAASEFLLNLGVNGTVYPSNSIDDASKRDLVPGERNFVLFDTKQLERISLEETESRWQSMPLFSSAATEQASVEQTSLESSTQMISRYPLYHGNTSNLKLGDLDPDKFEMGKYGRGLGFSNVRRVAEQHSRRGGSEDGTILEVYVDLSKGRVKFFDNPKMFERSVEVLMRAGMPTREAAIDVMASRYAGFWIGQKDGVHEIPTGGELVVFDPSILISAEEASASLATEQAPVEQTALESSTVDHEAAARASDTQRGRPEGVMYKVTHDFINRKISLPNQDWMLEHMGDLAHRAQEPGGIGMVSLREKLNAIKRKLPYLEEIYKEDLQDRAEFSAIEKVPELKTLDDLPTDQWKDHGITRRSDIYERLRNEHSDLIESEKLRIVDERKDNLDKYIQAHEEFNQPVTRMGELGKRIAIASAKMDWDAVESGVRALDSLVTRYESAIDESKNSHPQDAQENIRLRAPQSIDADPSIMLSSTGGDQAIQYKPEVREFFTKAFENLKPDVAAKRAGEIINWDMKTNLPGKSTDGMFAYESATFANVTDDKRGGTLWNAAHLKGQEYRRKVVAEMLGQKDSRSADWELLDLPQKQKVAEIVAAEKNIGDKTDRLAPEVYDELAEIRYGKKFSELGSTPEGVSQQKLLMQTAKLMVNNQITKLGERLKKRENREAAVAEYVGKIVAGMESRLVSRDQAATGLGDEAGLSQRAKSIEKRLRDTGSRFNSFLNRNFYDVYTYLRYGDDGNPNGVLNKTITPLFKQMAQDAARADTESGDLFKEAEQRIGMFPRQAEWRKKFYFGKEGVELTLSEAIFMYIATDKNKDAESVAAIKNSNRTRFGSNFNSVMSDVMLFVEGGGKDGGYVKYVKKGKGNSFSTSDKAKPGYVKTMPARNYVKAWKEIGPKMHSLVDKIHFEQTGEHLKFRKNYIPFVREDGLFSGRDVMSQLFAVNEQQRQAAVRERFAGKYGNDVTFATLTEVEQETILKDEASIKDTDTGLFHRNQGKRDPAGFVHSRTPGAEAAPLMLDAVAVIERYRIQADLYRSKANTLSVMNGILSSPKVLAALQRQMGFDEGRDFMRTLVRFAEREKYPFGRIEGLDGLELKAKGLRHRATLMTLALKVPSMIRQTISGVQSLGEIDPKYIPAYFGNFWSMIGQVAQDPAAILGAAAGTHNPFLMDGPGKEAWSLMSKYSPQVTKRYADPDLQDIHNAIYSRGVIGNIGIGKTNLAEVFMGGFRMMDLSTVTAVWYTAYESKLAQLTDSNNGIESETVRQNAAKFAEDTVAKTQPASGVTDRNLTQTGNEYMRSFFMYTGQLMKNFQYYRTDIIDPLVRGMQGVSTERSGIGGVFDVMTKGEYGQRPVAQKALFSVLLPAFLLGVTARRRLPEKDEPIKDLFGYTIASMPLIGPVFSYAVLNEWRDPAGEHVYLRATTSFGKVLHDTVNWDYSERTLKDALYAASTYSGFPSAILNATIEAIEPASKENGFSIMKALSMGVEERDE